MNNKILNTLYVLIIFLSSCYKDNPSENEKISSPAVPSNPSPADTAKGISVIPTLSWNCSDPNSYPLTYDVYLDTNKNPIKAISTNQPEKNIIVDTLAYSTIYYWKIIAKNNNGFTTSGPIWSFTTKSSQSGWKAQSSGTINTLYSVFFTNINTGVVVGDNGTILRTINEGATWETISSGTTATLNRISFVNELIGIIVGTGGTILRTTDGGKSWTPQISGTSEILYGVSFIDVNNGVVVGDNGTILLTKDAGTNWISQTPIKWDTIIPPFPAMFYDVCYPEPNHIIVLAGATWCFSLRTTNGGTTWAYKGNVPSNYPRIIFLNKDTGMMFCPNHMTGQDWTYVYKTTDGGNTWFQYGDIINGIYTRDISFVNPDNGMMVGDPFSVGGSSIERTTDGGKTWIPQLTRSSRTAVLFYGVFLIDANNGTIVGDGGTILHTKTGGM